MSKNYDKLLFVIALLLFGVGLGIYFIGAESDSGRKLKFEPLFDGAWEPVPVPEVASVEAAWPEAPEQSSGWVYDVFTPPQIYVDNEGQFSIIPIRDKIPPPPFGLRLIRMERPLYRIQLEGYIEEDFSDPDKRLLLFYDVKTKKSLRLRSKGHSEESRFEVLQFEITRHTVSDDDSSLIRVATATILDWDDGREYKLLHTEPLYGAGMEIVLQSAEYDLIEVHLQSAGERFETPLGSHTLDSIDFDAKTVTVTRHGTEQFDSETKTLRLENVKTEPPSTKESEGNIIDTDAKF